MEKFERAATTTFGAMFVVWLAFWLIKVISLPIFVVNIVYVVGAAQSDSLGTFDFFWLIASAIGLFIL